MFVRYTLKTIMRGLVGGRNINPLHKEHVCQVLAIGGLPIDYEVDDSEAPEAKITFSDKNVIDIHLHKYDYMVIFVESTNGRYKKS